MQRFTYYFPDGRSEVRTHPDGPLPRSGDVWIRGAYAGDVEPDPTNVRVGKAGVEAWKVVFWLRMSKNDRHRVVNDYPARLAEADVDAALWFYDLHREEIDREIDRELHATV